MSTRVKCDNPAAQIAEWQRRGLHVSSKGVKIDGPVATEPEKKSRKRELLPSVYVPPCAWIVGIEVVSPQSSKSMKATMGRKAGQRAAVCGLLGKHLAVLVPFAETFHMDRPITVKLARLGKGRLDSDNLQGAFKHVRDAVADLLGANDKSPLIRWVYDQLDSDRVGVRIMLAMEGDE